MIRRLEGVVVEMDLTSVVVDVSGVGYEVAVAGSGAGTLKEGARVVLYTHLAVRENAMDLYGFPTKRELAMFHHLITLPKIGPKTAMGILSQATTELIREAVERNDAVYLSKMSGIGKKSAEKIVQGLKDVLGVEDGFVSTASQSDTDVVDALVALGYSPQDARKALQALPEEHSPTNTRIKDALKILSGQQFD